MVAEAERLANVLTEAERAGGKALTELLDLAESPELRELLRGKLALLNRGQRWVVRQIEEHLVEISGPALRGLLQAMAAARVANVELVDRAVA